MPSQDDAIARTIKSLSDPQIITEIDRQLNELRAEWIGLVRRRKYLARVSPVAGLPARACEICGNEFRPLRVKSRYCSLRCTNTAGNRKRAKR
jgi:hypothetical protein